MKKFALVSIPLVAALAIAAYLFLGSPPMGPETASKSEPTPEPADLSGLPDAQPAGGMEKSSGNTTRVADEGSLKRESETTGDETTFTMNHGEIGYVDVDSVLKDLNPYSVIALLQNHQNLTGATESLEITIDEVSENEFWGYEATFEQLIDGRPTRGGGTVFFSSSGAVTRMYGDILNDQAINTGNVVIQQAEAEAIAREVAAGLLEPRLAKLVEEFRGTEHEEGARRAADEARTKPPAIYRTDFRYVLDSEKRLRAEWQVSVDMVRVHVAADTGKVVDIEDAVVYTTR